MCEGGIGQDMVWVLHWAGWDKVNLAKGVASVVDIVYGLGS